MRRDGSDNAFGKYLLLAQPLHNYRFGMARLGNLRHSHLPYSVVVDPFMN